MKKVFTSRYDIAGNSFFRVTKLGILNKLFIVGNFKHGVGLRPACTLLILHYCGKPLFCILTRFERYFHRLYQILGKEKLNE